MENQQGNRQPKGPVIADAEWMMIHCDTFISERERIQQKEKAFVIDRDLHSAIGHLPNDKVSHKGLSRDQRQPGEPYSNEYLNL